MYYFVHFVYLIDQCCYSKFNSKINLKQQVGDLIGADPKDVIFTSGATESNNIAIKGIANFYKKKKNHIITTQVVKKLNLNYLFY